MAISLGSNTSSLAAQRELSQATSSLAQSYERLSSGQRINNASDDAAGLAIASQLNSKAQVYTQAIRNVNDGASIANIAEGALGALKSISQRQLELAEEAANGTYSIKQRGALNTEANALVDEYNRIVASTKFNGLNLFDPSLGSVIIQAGGSGNVSSTLQLGLSNQLERPVGTGTFVNGEEASTTSVALFGNTSGVVEGDFNGDGKLDFITANYTNYYDGQQSLFLGNGDGTFQQSAIPTGNNTLSNLQTADFNGDGKLDLTFVQNGGGLEVELGNGNGTFKAASLLAGPSALNIAVGDVNGDGNTDIVVVSGSQVLTRLGNGNGTFGAAKTTSVGVTGSSITLADVNGDGKLDFLAGLSNGRVAIGLGNGNGTFAAPVTLVSGGNVESIVAADFNGDGNVDFAAANNNGSTTVFIGNGNGTFKGAATISIGSTVDGVNTADFNGDGKTDLLLTDAFGQDYIFFGNGDGTFKFSSTSALQSFSGEASVVGDFTGDGVSDFVTVGYSSQDQYNIGTEQFFQGNGTYTSTAPYLNINTQQGARDALNTVNANLNRIEGQLGSIGAITSRFQAALGNLQTEDENFQAAAGRIQDTDVAQESANLVRTQILQQAAASVLAQANQQPGIALKLLGG